MTDAASARQSEAADPGFSTWLSANAGSGKTSVLIDRVARLLLAQVPPQRILCLTYTKAAASEMQNRLFKLLGSWAMLPEPALRAALMRLSAGPIDAEALARARRLFARAIETPGGLKIQTIHAFCAALLRRFPLEAGVTPQFTEMEDRAASLLREEVVEELATGRELPLVDAVARLLGGADFAALTAEIAADRDGFAHPLDRDGALALFGLAPGTTAADILAEALPMGPPGWWPKLLDALAQGSTTDVKAADRLAALPVGLPEGLAEGLAQLEPLEEVLLTGKGAKEPFTAKIGSFPTKATRAGLGPLLPELEALMARVEAVRPRRLALLAAERSLALHRFARVFLERYAARKAERGWLDFDDLILRAAALLSDPSVAQWVLYRLDGGIDHILVDEAQDTSPAQWQVIALLAQEFTAGEGARQVARTIFVVGDKKQSIYSFQGADLAEFDRMQADFAARLAAAGLPFQPLELEHSFRSSPAILRLVDLAFDAGAQAGLGGATRHLAYRAAMPGRVDLWPLIPKAEAPEDGEWFDPLDRVAETHPTAVLARQIAAELARLIAAGTQITVKGVTRPLHAGDVLILVQRRSELFHEIIRACKAAGLAVAGADRLKLGAELAVRDLTALLSFIALDADDLSLAAALRSPLFGWSEAQLYTLAAGRGGARLWEALRAGKEAWFDTYETLRELRDASDFLRPYDLIERVLTRHDGRRRLIARLGPEAEEGIDALLAQALGYERMEVPSLTGFLVWLESGEAEVKRRPEAEGTRLRVMTVHASKGLEAPLVILPDTIDRQLPAEGRVLRLDGVPAWRGAADSAPPALAAAAADLARRRQEENLRLLYVAMTRAQSWLIVCGAGEATKDFAWYRLVEQGLRQAGAEFRCDRVDFPPGPGLRLSHGDWPPEAAAATHETAAAPPLPAWARSPAPAPQEPPPPLSPSALGGAKALPGETEADPEAALRHGRQLHRLLEHLPAHPPAAWPDLAARLLAGPEDRATPEEAAELLAEAGAVLSAPDLAPLFVAPALTEVEIAADLGTGRLVGAIDRLIVAPDRVLAIDFKSNRLIPDRPEAVPEGLLRQMAAYGAALAQVYPDRVVELALLWTRGPSLMRLPPDIVAAALATTSPS